MFQEKNQESLQRLERTDRMIEEYDKVRIKATGVIGEIIDIYTVGGEKHYTVESDEKGVPGGRGAPDSWKLFDCLAEELEKIGD